MRPGIVTQTNAALRTIQGEPSMPRTLSAALLFALLLCSPDTFQAFADAPSHSAAEQPASSELLLQTPGSSRQSHLLPFEPYVNGVSNKNFPLVRVKINDTVSGTFTLDTGASFSIISDELANQLKLKRQTLLSQGKTVLLEGKPLNGVTLDKVDLGGFKFAKYMFGVLQKKRIALPTRQIDGIIGIDLLQNFEYSFDFSKHHIIMLAPARLVMPTDGSPQSYILGGLTPEEVSALGFSNAKSAPLGSAEDGRMYVHAQIADSGKDESADLILDTGAGTTIISPSLAEQLNLKPLSENVESTGFPGIEYISTARVAQFQVGDLVLNNQLLDYSSQRIYDKNLPPAFGMDIMSKYQVLMDFQNKKIYFKPNPSVVPAVTIGPAPAPAAPPAK